MKCENSKEVSSFRLERWWVGGMVVLILGMVVVLALRFYPEKFLTVDWVANEHGNQLHRAALILQGKVPYRDFACQYGPIPLFLWAGFAGITGATAGSCAYFHALCSLVVVAILFGSVSRAVRSRGELLILAGVIVAAALSKTLYSKFMLVPLQVSAEYVCVERIWLLLLAALWKPPETRTWRDAALVGGVFLGWQLSKFGGACFGIAAYGVADALAVVWISRPGGFGCLIRNWVRIGVCCLMAEAARAALFFALLPPADASRAAWPFWVLELYP